MNLHKSCLSYYLLLVTAVSDHDSKSICIYFRRYYDWICHVRYKRFSKKVAFYDALLVNLGVARFMQRPYNLVALTKGLRVNELLGSTQLISKTSMASS